MIVNFKLPTDIQLQYTIDSIYIVSPPRRLSILFGVDAIRRLNIITDTARIIWVRVVVLHGYKIILKIAKMMLIIQDLW